MPCVRELLEIFIELKRLRADGIKARRCFLYRQYTDLRLIVKKKKYVEHSNVRHTLFILLPKKVILYFMVTAVGL